VTGCDALIHALHRLGAADDAWDRTLRFAGTELQEDRGVKDVFAIQSRLIHKMRSLYRLLTPGSERPREAKLNWWDRFQTAGGMFPTIARFAVAAAILGAVLVMASSY
jgi:hypothetical protein